METETDGTRASRPCTQASVAPLLPLVKGIWPLENSSDEEFSQAEGWPRGREFPVLGE